MGLYCGVDLHSTNSYLAVLNENLQSVLSRRVPNRLDAVVGALEPFRERLQAVAVESTFNWYWLVDGLMEAGYQVKLVNTAAVAVYEGLKYTGDEHDARHLAHLVRCRTAQVLSIQNLVSRNCGHGISMEEIRALDDSAIARLCDGGGERA